MILSRKPVYDRTPKISICIPAYKAPQFFKRVIDSVTVQEYTDYEIIVTDDSPDDSIRDILAATTLPVPFTYVRNAERLGPPGNWNRAVGLAKGEYIKILHHDDWLLSSRSLAQFVALMDANPGAVMAFSSAEAYDQDQCLKFVHSPPIDRITELRRDPRVLFFGNFIGPPSSIIYRNLSGVVFDEKLKWLVDIDFYIRLLEGKKSFSYSEEPLVGVTIDSSHQVTRECENNKNVEVREYLYLYSKLLSEKRRFVRDSRFFSQLFERFSITSCRELSELAPDVKIPWQLKLLVFLRV